MIDYTPPQAPDMERAVLGAMMLETEAIDICMAMLDPEAFYKPQHLMIFKAIKQLWNQNIDVDQLSLTQQITDNGQLDAIGGEVTIVGIAAETTSTASIKHHIEILNEKAQQRSLLVLSKTIETTCLEDGAKSIDIISSTTNRIDEILSKNTNINYSEMSDVIHDAYDSIYRKSEAKYGLTGITTGFQRLNELTAGWQKTDSIIIAANVSAGKTTLALQFALAAAKADHWVGIFSMEMSSVRLGERFIGSMSDFVVFDAHKIEVKSHEWKRMADSANILGKLPIIIDETPGLNLNELTARAKRMVRERKVELIVIDYMQLMAGMGEDSRQQSIENISRGLKGLAKMLDISVIVISQFKRRPQGQENRRPILSDLRNSGASEADADVVIFIYDPPIKEKQNWISDNKLELDSNDIDIMREVIIAKQRNGPTATMMAFWQAKYYKFLEVETRR